MTRSTQPLRLSRWASPRAALILLLWLVVLVLGMRSVLSRLSVPSWGNPLGDAQSPELGEGSHAEQSFAAPLPGLAGVEVTICAAPSTETQRVTLHLTEDQEGTWLGEKTVDVGPGASEMGLRLDLAPIANSQGRTFRLSVESDAPPGQGVTVRYSPGSAVPDASAYFDGKRIGGNLQFQTYYTLNTRQKVDLILTRLAEGKPRGLDSRCFYVGSGLVYAGVLGLFVWRIVMAALGREKDRP